MSARQQLATYEDDLLQCRIERHHFNTRGWYNFTDDVRRKHRVRESECATCGTLRKTFYTPKYEREFAVYDYAEGYRFVYDKDEPRIAGPELMRAVTKNAVIYKDRDALLVALGEHRAA